MSTDDDGKTKVEILAEAIDDMRETFRAAVAGLVTDGFTKREAHALIAGVFAANTKGEGETTTEWNVLDHGEPYLQPWTWDEDEARSYSNVVDGPLVKRERTTYDALVTEWVEV